MSLILLVSVGGCGESEGVANGATATAYVAAAFCSEARRELARHGGEAGGLHIRAICLLGTEVGRKLKLAQIGTNARRATQDSRSIAYIGEPSRAASRFAETILEEAGIAQLTEASGATAMRELIHAVDEAGNSRSLRQSVLDELE